MRFVCEQCQTRYTIPDEKARGRALKVRCKKCSNVIVLRPEAAVPAEPAPSNEGEATMVASPEALEQLRASLKGEAKAALPAEPAPPPPDASEVEWYAIVNGSQQGPMTKQEMAAKIGAGVVRNRHYVWTENLGDWKRLEDVPELAVYLAEPTAQAVPRSSPTTRQRAAPVAQNRTSSSAELQAVFEDVPLEDGEAAAGAVNDPFASVPDSPDIVKPGEMGEMTRFVIAQSGVEQGRSPWRIAGFVAGGLAVMAGLLVSLSRLGVELPLVHRAAPSGSNETVYSGSGGNGRSLHDMLLGSPRGPPKPAPAARSAPRPGAVPEQAPLAHKEAQHVERLDDSQRMKLAALYGKTTDPNVKMPVATAATAPTIDRPDAPLTAEQVSSTVSHYRSGYGRCMDQELKRNPNFRGGKVRIVTTIMSSGIVRGAEIQSDDGSLASRLQNSQLGSCLVDQTRRMVFPSFAGDPFDAEIPLVLGASM